MYTNIICLCSFMRTCVHLYELICSEMITQAQLHAGSRWHSLGGPKCPIVPKYCPQISVMETINNNWQKQSAAFHVNYDGYFHSAMLYLLLTLTPHKCVSRYTQKVSFAVINTTECEQLFLSQSRAAPIWCCFISIRQVVL